MPQPSSVESPDLASLATASPDVTSPALEKSDVRPPTGEDLIALTRSHVRAYMSRYDSSHDFAHIERVLGLALHIFSSSSPNPAPAPSSSPPPFTTFTHAPPLRPLSHTTVTLAALLHDIGDKKYLPPSSSSLLSTADGTTLALSFLLSIGCNASLAHDVQDIVNCVSYSHEIVHPAVVQEVLERLPELGCVQDADRLDALGAVGVGRAFTYAASVRAGRVARAGGGSGCGSAGQGGDGIGEELSSSMEDTIRHFEEKLVRLEGMMKTGRGREMARERTERLRVFKCWWEEETGLAEAGGV